MFLAARNSITKLRIALGAFVHSLQTPASTCRVLFGADSMKVKVFEPLSRDTEVC